MRVIAAAIVALGLLATARTASAYPQFQLSTGAQTCRQCHFSPAGGGLINDYGRDEAGTTLAQWESDGGFLHGAWTPPERIPIGGDLRAVAGFRRSDDAGTENLVFPMQMELYLRPNVETSSGTISLYINAGARPDRSGTVAPASREHFLMYEPSGASWYVRAGRFFPIYGIRTQDHTSNLRRDLDMYIYDEPYGAAWGNYGDSSELHLSAFVRSPDVLGTGQHSGVAAYWEKQADDDASAFAAQTRLSFAEDDRQAWVGGIYKRWLEGPGVMLLGEVDVGYQRFAHAPDADDRQQLAAYLGATWFARQGLLVGAVLQGYDEDLRVEQTSHESAELNVQWFPIAHVEAHVLTRVETAGFETGSPIYLMIAQLHYYL